MRRECYVSQPLEIEVFQIKSGTDIIMRRNITKVNKEPMEEGGEETEVYECDEVQFRHYGAIDKAEIESDFEFWWNIGEGKTEIEASDETAKEKGKPTVLERLEAVEGAIIELVEVLVNG